MDMNTYIKRHLNNINIHLYQYNRSEELEKIILNKIRKFQISLCPLRIVFYSKGNIYGVSGGRN